MTENPSTAAPSLDALCQRAGQRAAAWPSATGAGHASTADRSRRHRLLKGALVAVFGALTLAVLAANLDAQRVPLRAVRLAQDAPLALQQPQADAGAADAVRWQGDELVVDLDGVPLPQAVAWLAQVTRSTVTGTEWLEPAAVTLHFRGRDVNAAWRLLLQGRAAVALSCGASLCHVWLSGPAAAPGAAAGPAQPRVDAQPGARPADAVPSENESQPGGSC